MKDFQTIHYASPKGYRQALADFKSDSLEVVKIGYLAADTRLLAPVVQVDASNRPDLHDLARVHRTDGEFDTTTTWDFCIKHGSTGLARLTVAINSPIKTRFSLTFQLARYYDYLVKLAQDFTFVSIKFDKSPMEDVIAFVMDPQTLKEGLIFYLSDQITFDLKGGNN
jgi:hypothetical protein